ncbi:hypothetical protein DQ04_00051270 [Trypanosoma grayi]|uniref:hypothetical protein n=1 Tax=Trypanosoma grayi TaxID=71804 RepID=UPI0004F4B663|nr:hypothetical protein DQ04_00051270 [Trypanosoma grayi]KEG15532.1 hypothetical protein DQ04_00051270 [Trypanosoma grayi]
MPLTRVAQSGVVPGANGVFLTRAVKKFAPIEVAPLPGAIAPPYMENLVRAPRHTVSLRRFLALRHRFSTGQYFNVPTAAGWYLIAPSSHAPLPDASGLLAWHERHHHRYMQDKIIRRKKPRQSPSATITEARGSEGGSSSAMPQRQEEEEEEEGKEVSKEQIEECHAEPCSSSLCNSRLTSGMPLPVVTPLTIPEDHLFEINDGVLWETPPRDDLASPTYWQRHRERMQVYEDTSVGIEQEDLFVLPRPTDEAMQNTAGATEWDRYTQQQRLFQSLTRKANVKLSVDDATRLLTLVPIVDLKEGEELLLHYGREWWSERLLSTVFMAVADGEMRGVRWIEALFTKPTDVAKPFPLLCSAVARRKVPSVGKGVIQGGNTTRCDSSESTSGGKILVLYNMVTRCKATDTEALVFSVRRSCVDRDFFSRLVGARGTCVFDVSRCDDEVPLRHLRRALLQSLHPKRDAADVGVVAEDEESDGSLML